MSRKIGMMVERQIVTRVIEDLLAAGYLLGVNNGEDTMLEDCTNKDTILGAMFTTDEDYLLVSRHRGDEHRSFVHFIYGNDEAVLSDYGINIKPVIGPVMDWVNETYCD